MTNRILQFMESFNESLKNKPVNEITTIDGLAGSVAKGRGTLEGFHITEEDETVSQEYQLDNPHPSLGEQTETMTENNRLQHGVSTEEERIREFRSNMSRGVFSAPTFPLQSTFSPQFSFAPNQPFQSPFQPPTQFPFSPQQPPLIQPSPLPTQQNLTVERDYYDFQSPLYEDVSRINRDELEKEESAVEDLNLVGQKELEGVSKLYLKDGKLQQKVGFLENTFCEMTDNEKMVFIDVFMGWTSIDYDEHTEDEMLDELNNVRVFLKHDLSIILGLTGVMRDINQSMFMKELDEFNEQELMAYVLLFHLDLQPLDDLQERLKEKYSTLYHTNGTTDDQLEEMQKINLQVYLTQLKTIIFDFKLWMLYRLRLWRWREEVLLGNVASKLTTYPGVIMIFEFESSADILENGIYDYYMRVGEAKRETLMDRFGYFDLYHMMGKLSMAYDRELDFGTNTQYEDLADAILSILDEMEVDPRHLLTPYGVRVIYNSEEEEVIYNLYRYQEHDEELLRLACTHAGIDVMINTVEEQEDETEQQTRDSKPITVLIEELTSQYLSPQFFSAIEYHRDYRSAVASFRTLSGDRLTNAEEADIIFYGIGDGMSTYRVYKPRELVEVFIVNNGFVDPYSIKENPNNPDKWSRFSTASIKRLLRIVIPRLRVKSKNNGDIHTEAVELKEALELREDKRSDLDDLENAIMIGLDNLDKDDPETIDEFVKPRGKQTRILNYLKQNLELIRIPLAGFLTYMFNLGVQLSDWDEHMVRLDENVIHTALITDPLWKYFDPETTANLTEKIFKMLTAETEKYINIIGSNGEDFTRHIKGLRLVRHYLDTYRIDWDDELSTIGGHLYRMIQANGLSYYNYVSLSGNWLMSTANYYSIELLEQPMGNVTIGFIDEPVDLKDYINNDDSFEL